MKKFTKEIASLLTSVAVTTTIGVASASSEEIVVSEGVALNPDYTTITTTAETRTISVDFIIKSLPDKLVYEIGEELDITGGVIYASGTDGVMCWDEFYQPFDYPAFHMDTSEFDNQTPGIYNIYFTYYGYKYSFSVEVMETPLMGVMPVADGDINSDGLFDAIDVIMIQDFMLGFSDMATETIWTADFDYDGKISIYDFIMLKQKLINLNEN